MILSYTIMTGKRPKGNRRSAVAGCKEWSLIKFLCLQNSAMLCAEKNKQIKSA